MTRANSNLTQHWGITGLLGLGAFGFGITGCFLAMDTIVLPTMVLNLVPEEAKNTFLSGLGLSGMIVAALVQPIAGWYSDRTSTPLGRRVPFILWSAIFVTLGLSGLVVTTSYWSLFVMWLFIQANANIGFGPFNALIRDLVPNNRIGVASSLKILAEGAGGVTMVAAAGLIISRYTGPETGHWLGAALGIIAATVIGSAAISAYTVVTRERAHRFSFRRNVETLTRRSGLHTHLIWYLLSRYLLVTAVMVFPTYGLFFLVDVVAVENPAQTLGLIIFAIGAAFVLSVYPAGRLSDRVGHKPVVVIGSAAAAVATVAILAAGNHLAATVAMLAGGSRLQVLVIAGIPIGFALGVVLSASWAMANELGAEGREGQHMGIVNLATTGGAASAKLLGPGVDLLNLASPGLGYYGLLAGCAAAFVGGALLILPVNPSRAPVAAA